MEEVEVPKTTHCPEHKVDCKFIPPAEIDKKRRKFIVKFECPAGHIFTKEFDLG